MTLHRRAYRRTRLAAAGLALALIATWVASSTAGAVSDPGQGTAVGQILRVDPRAGSLSVGVGVGEALAGHQNQSAKAQSLSLDLGVIGTSLTTASCGSAPAFQPNQLPQTLIVESGQPNADKGETATQYGALTQYGIATKAPLARAVTTIAPLTIPGLLSIAGGTATSWSGIVDGHRQAGATVDITGISILGQVSLAALHWEVLHQSTGPEVHTGSFSIGAIKLAGTTVSLPDVTTALSQANGILGLVGIHLDPPKVHLTQGIEYVDPLQIAVVPNATRDKLASVLLGAVQPVRQPLYSAILKAICKASTAIEVSDIAIGAVTGAGSFDLQFGGVQAGTGEVSKNGFNLGIPGISLNVPPVLTSSGGTQESSSYAAPSASGPAPTDSVTTLPTPAAGPLHQQAIRPITASKGHKGGALAVVALVGLALLALIAEGDRRMMRRAQRAATE